MAGVTPSQQQEQQQTPAAAAAVMTPEEEFLKRNTDCVYFLASPLTCKKGSECEYRHSDIARLNPRDCWYWLNGNCLNPKCAFRHPPLDGLLGAEIPSPVPPPMPQLQTPPIPAPNPPYGASKQGVPCIFFQKGYCLKGDRCPFLHPPTSSTSKVAQFTATAPVTDPPIAKKTFGGLEKCTTQEQKVFQSNIPKPVDLPPQRKPVNKVEVVPTRNGVVVEKNVPPPPPPSILGDELPRYRPRSVPPTNERSVRAYQTHVTDSDSTLNGKDGDEFSREPSPGFDVLVDDEGRDSDYYPSEEQFGGRGRGHEVGRNMNNSMNDYDLGRSSDYKPMADVDQDMYRDPRDYDSYERIQGGGHYGGWGEEKRRSSERMLGGGSSHGQRRGWDHRDASPDELVDLRQHISKQRKGSNGLRSVVSREHTRDSYAEDRDYRQGPRRESHLAPPSLEGSLSSRLRGRIKLPDRSISPVNENDRDRDVGRHRARLSPVRLNTITSQGSRLRDRIKGRVQEDLPEEGRDFRGGHLRRDGIIDSKIGFSGPKRLSELKSGKINEGHESSQINGLQSLGKRKYPKVDALQQEGELSFEGPKPLSEILKRKKGGGYNNEGSKDGTESLIKSTVYDGNKEESKQVGMDKIEETDKEETEEGLIGGEDAIDDQELENFDEGGDFDYEQQVEGEDYNLEEGKNVEGEEEEYFDEDDGDDFAKQMGVELS